MIFAHRASCGTYAVQDQRVALDEGLARVFGVETKRFNGQLRRNLARFDGYAFQLSAQERNIRCS